MMYRILIVEDDPSIAAGLSYALEKEDYFVTQCRSVAEAFEISDEVHFDLAVLDMQLPDGLGKKIGQKLQAEQTQVIYLTVVDDEDEIVHTLENGWISWGLSHVFIVAIQNVSCNRRSR